MQKFALREVEISMKIESDWSIASLLALGGGLFIIFLNDDESILTTDSQDVKQLDTFSESVAFQLTNPPEEFEVVRLTLQFNEKDFELLMSQDQELLEQARKVVQDEEDLLELMSLAKQLPEVWLENRDVLEWRGYKQLVDRRIALSEEHAFMAYIFENSKERNHALDLLENFPTLSVKELKSCFNLFDSVDREDREKLAAIYVNAKVTENA